MTVVFCHEVWVMDPPLDYPVVTREFRGGSREEARSRYLAHYGTDQALQRCVERDEHVMPDGAVVRCAVRAWFDDDDARIERVARAWIAARHRRSLDLFDAVPPGDEGDDGPTPRVGFRPRVIEGGAGTRSDGPSGEGAATRTKGTRR